nr:MAG TPA: hypothetical protein [Caudoviricetes sp.]
MPKRAILSTEVIRWITKPSSGNLRGSKRSNAVCEMISGR